MTKSDRLRGSQTYGRGYNKNKSGSKGGVGAAGLKTHKKISYILAQKNAEKHRKVTTIRDIESKLDRYIKKKFIRSNVVNTELGAQVRYTFTSKFANKYKKILSQGEPSGTYVVPSHLKLKVSQNTKKKF